MHANWKQLVFLAALASPVAVIAGEGKSTTEQSNHVTNKKAVAMEAKEEKVSGAVRNWSAIDTDKDHSISPDEMQKYLTEIWNAKGKS
jgi:actin-related protein